MRIPLRNCQQRLAQIWLLGGGLLFVLVLAQTLMGHYPASSSEDAWNWLLPSVLPTTSLIVTTLFQTLDAEEKTVDQFLFRLCSVLSLVYLLVLLVVVLMQPSQSGSAAETLKRSNIFLAPLQAIVAGAVAALFGKAEKNQPHVVAVEKAR